MVTNALLDWRGAAVLAIAVVLSVLIPAPIASWQPWYWLAGGAVLWLAISVAVFANPNTAAQVVAEMLRAKFDPAEIKDLESRQRIEKGLEYRAQIEAAVNRARQGLLRDNLAETAVEIDAWLENMYSLALRLDAFKADRTIQQDFHSVPSTLETYEQRMKTVTDDKLRAQMREIYEAKTAQWTSLKNLRETMERARLQMDNALTALGTVYSQILLIGVKDVDSGRAQRLRDDIAEEVERLQDVVTAMDEVYQYAH